MRFLVYSHVIHTKCDGKFFGYGPYVKEMNIWGKHVSELWILAPLSKEENPDPIDLAYQHQKVRFIKVPSFQIKSLKDAPNAVWACLVILSKGFFYSLRADHLHLRCPGNMGLLACLIQILLPWKSKTAKYAGNWDPKARKPWSYKLQQKILNSRFLTQRMKVLAYGEWEGQSSNILPFFTATYSESDIVPIKKEPLSKGINLVFVGSMTENKSPQTAYQVYKKLRKNGFVVFLDFLGKGPELDVIRALAKKDDLTDGLKLWGNVEASKVKEILQKAHFLVFVSKSEGWPKAVAEAMFWGCVPITTPVSCVPQMLNFGERGFLIDENSNPAQIISDLFKSESNFTEISEKASAWSRKYTLEYFEEEIQKLL